MPRLSMIPTFAREVFGQRTLPREPEPALVMDDPEEVAAYSEAGRIDGVMAAAYLYHSARISQVIQGCSQVIDLGCGPATQLAQVAQLNPEISFLGMDLSSPMLESAESHVRSLGLTNVQFRLGDITRLESVADQSADAVISTMALHHLPSMNHLRACFQEISRVLRPGGALYLVDFGRLKSLRSVLFFAYMNAKHQPHLFSLDYERSLRAAFLLEDFQSMATECLPRQAKVYSTFKMPILVLIKSPDKPLPDMLKARLKEMRQTLPSRYRHDLEDIRMLFKLGGLGNDPFR